MLTTILLLAFYLSPTSIAPIESTLTSISREVSLKPELKAESQRYVLERILLEHDPLYRLALYKNVYDVASETACLAVVNRGCKTTFDRVAHAYGLFRLAR